MLANEGGGVSTWHNVDSVVVLGREKKENKRRAVKRILYVGPRTMGGS